MGTNHKVEWKNTTRHSQNTIDRDVVKTTTLDADGLNLVVTKHIDYGEELVVRCAAVGINTLGLGTEDMAEGQRKAIAIVESKLCSMMDIIDQVRAQSKDSSVTTKLRSFKVVGHFKSKKGQLAPAWIPKGIPGRQAQKRVYTSLEDFNKYAPETIRRYSELYDVDIFELIGAEWVPYKL